MTHIIYLVMMIGAHGVPQQMGTDATLEKCNADITQAAENHGQMGFVKSNYWYCQPTVAPANVPPFN